MFFCQIATIDPTKIDEKDTNIIIWDQLSTKLSNGTYSNLIKTIIAAIFGTQAKKDVTGVEDPWYTSGAHIWNGTAEILKIIPASKNASPIVIPMLSLDNTNEFISLKNIVPVKPYIREDP